MRWKTILRVGIIIYTFFIITIECKTNIMAMSSINAKLNLAESTFHSKINKTVKVFSGDFAKGKIVCTEYVLTENLNETDEELLTRLLKISPQGEENDILGIPNDSNIEHIEINPEGNRALINMTQAYRLTNYGVLGEYLALQSLLRTVVDYYNVETAVISVGGKLYCSGHFCFEEINKDNTIK